MAKGNKCWNVACRHRSANESNLYIYGYKTKWALFNSIPFIRGKVIARRAGSPFRCHSLKIGWHTNYQLYVGMGLIESRAPHLWNSLIWPVYLAPIYTRLGSDLWLDVEPYRLWSFVTRSISWLHCVSIFVSLSSHGSVVPSQFLLLFTALLAEYIVLSILFSSMIAFRADIGVWRFCLCCAPLRVIVFVCDVQPR